MRDRGIDREPGRLAEAEDAGFSLIEVVIAATILFTIIAMAGRFVLDSNRMLGAMSVRSGADVKAAFLADKIARNFRNGSLDSFRWYYGWSETTPTYHENASNYGQIYPYCYARNVVDQNLGKAVLGDGYFYYGFIQGESDISDGVDNDKDGRVDECELRECHILASAYVATDVPTEVPTWNWYSTPGKFTKLGEIVSNGLQFKLTGRTLSIKVTVPQYDPTLQKQINVTAESTVKLRN